MTDPSSVTLSQAREHLRFANSYNRLEKVIELAWLMEADDWCKLLGEEWSTCDNIGRYYDELLDTPFADTQAEPSVWRDALMTEDERAKFDALPDRLTVFRGCYGFNKWGFSWSLDRDVAARFPFLHRYRQNEQALLVRATVAKRDIVALKHDRQEAEVICWRPKHVATSHLCG